MSIDWKQVSEQANWGIVIGSADGQCMEQMNPAFARMHGYTVAELVGAPILTVFAPEVRPEVAGHIERAHRLGHYRFESLHLHRDGYDFPVLIDVTTVKGAEGAVLYRIVNVQDLSAQKKSEQVLRAAQAEYAVKDTFLKSLYENAPVAKAVCALDGRYISVNRAMCEILGYSEAELLSMTYVDVSHPDDASGKVAFRQRMLERQEPCFEMRKRYVRKDGSVLWAHMVVSLVTDSAGRPLYTIGQMMNISNEKFMEEQLAEARAQRDTLVREVHHRIKNNLQSVTGLLYRQKLAHPEVGAALSNAIQQVETIAIIHGLQSGEQRGHLRLCDMLAEIVAATRALNAEAAAIVLYNELQRPLLIVDDETVPLALVLNELITNATKYVDPAHPAGINVTMSRVGADGALVTVSNPVPVRSPIFDFESGAGVGMGLKLVRLLLPPAGARIQFRQDAEMLTAQIYLEPPVVQRADKH